ncbi:MAG: hypothetical protein WBB28_13705 [Crinalium sp.]
MSLKILLFIVLSLVGIISFLLASLPKTFWRELSKIPLFAALLFLFFYLLLNFTISICLSWLNIKHIDYPTYEIFIILIIPLISGFFIIYEIDDNYRFFSSGIFIGNFITESFRIIFNKNISQIQDGTSSTFSSFGFFCAALFGAVMFCWILIEEMKKESLDSKLQLSIAIFSIFVLSLIPYPLFFL